MSLFFYLHAMRASAYAAKSDLHLPTRLQTCDVTAGARARSTLNDSGREGERGSAEMQIFARKLITRINSSQNIQTGCQTVRLHTPPSPYPPHPPRLRAKHRISPMQRPYIRRRAREWYEHDRYNAHITCPPVFSASANWLQTDLPGDFISIRKSPAKFYYQWAIRLD